MTHPRDDHKPVLTPTPRGPINQRERASSNRAAAAEANAFGETPEEGLTEDERIVQEQVDIQNDPTTAFSQGRASVAGLIPTRVAPGEQPIFGTVFPLQEAFDPDAEAEETDASDRSLLQLAEQGRLQQQRRKLEKELVNLEEREEDPSQALAARDLREQVELDLAQNEVDLLNLQNSLGIQDKLAEHKLERAGLTDKIDLTPLKEALDVDGGLGDQTLQAILDIADNVALSEKEQDDAIDIVMARHNISGELIKTVNDMVDRNEELEELNAMTDAQLLDDAGKFIAPMLQFDVQGDNDADRFLNNMINEISPFLDLNVPHTIPTLDPSYQTYADILLGAMKVGINADIQKEIIALAEIWDMDPDAFEAAIEVGLREAEASNTAWNNALDADEAHAGTGELIAALWQAGEAIGWNPDQLEMAAKSEDLHALIESMSGGVSGTINQGNIAGIGGLTLDMYKHVMGGQEWTAKRGMAWELTALLSYIDEFFQGDALLAVRFFRDSGEWGGESALSGGSGFGDKEDEA